MLRAELSGTDFQYAKLLGADLRSTELSGVNFQYADLTSADFSASRGRHLDFRQATVGQLPTQDLPALQEALLKQGHWAIVRGVLERCRRGTAKDDHQWQDSWHDGQDLFKELPTLGDDYDWLLLPQAVNALYARPQQAAAKALFLHAVLRHFVSASRAYTQPASTAALNAKVTEMLGADPALRTAFRARANLLSGISGAQ